MEIILACVFAYWLIKHGPELIAEAIAELEFARRGEMSPLAEARLKRLLDAGIDPAFGGPMRQFAGNAWRDLWLGLDAARRRQRAAPRAGGGWFDRLRERIDDAVSERARRWRQRQDTSTSQDTDTDMSTGQDTDRGGSDDPDGHPPPGDYPPPAADDPPSPAPEPEPARPAPGPDPDAGPDADDRPDDAASAWDGPADRELIRVPSTVGDPIPNQPAAPEGNEPMTAVVHVTGVASGAAEARAIERQIQAATAAYVAAIAAARRRIHHLGEATLGEIQQAVHSRVVAALQASAEAAAAAEHAARVCAGEVSPQLMGVARQFDRISS